MVVHQHRAEPSPRTCSGPGRRWREIAGMPWHVVVAAGGQEELPPVGAAVGLLYPHLVDV